MSRQRFAWTVAAIALSSCAIGPNYERPETPAPKEFRFAHGAATAPAASASSAQSRSFADLPWWSLYKDPCLQHLLATALDQNLDLRIAVSRVEAAHAVAVADVWALAPRFSVSASAQREKNAFAVPSIAARAPFNNFGVSLGANWEIDLWGRLRRLSEAGWADFYATEENRRAVVAGLVAEVAQDYFQLRGLDLQRQIAERTVASRTQTLQLYRSRLQAGIGAQPEVSNGEALLAQAQAQHAVVISQIGQVEDRLSVVLAKPPGEIARTVDEPVELAVPDIPPGLPSSLLERRPDIRAAEQQLVAANALVGAADASFFPQISLTGTFGFLSTELANILHHGGESWSFGASTSLPIPALGNQQLLAARAEAIENFNQAKASYTLAILTAFQEVSDALLAEQQLRAQIGFLEKQVDATRTQRELAVSRFKAGVASYLEITTADESLFPAELALAQARTQHALSIVQLYRALGGGWSVPAEEAASH